VRRAVLSGLGVLLLLVAAAGVAYPLWWQHRQSTVGRREVLALARAGGSGCSVSTPPGPGILRIPSLSVVAPVVQGVSDATLAVSVGHFPGSPWPGERGTAILEAHDVGYFASNSSLVAGDLVTYETGCRVDTYRVVRKDVLHPGQAIPSPGRRALALVSCWPTDALWFTSSRLVVTAELVSVGEAVPGSDPLSATVPSVPGLPPGVPAPPDLLDTGWLAGTFTLTGSPALDWKDGPQPLAWQDGALAAFSAARQGVLGHKPWLAELAPGVTVPHAIAGHYADNPVNVTEEVDGTAVVHMTVATVVGGAPVSVTVAPVHGVLLVVGAT